MLEGAKAWLRHRPKLGGWSLFELDSSVRVCTASPKLSSVAGCPSVQCTEISSLDRTKCPVGNWGLGTMPHDYTCARCQSKSQETDDAKLPIANRL